MEDEDDPRHSLAREEEHRMPGGAGQPRIFVSYARRDGREMAADLRARLAAQGFSLWQDLADMEGGRDWWRQITEAVDGVEHVLLVTTPAALASEVVRREWRYAREQGRCVVPVTKGGTSGLDLVNLAGWMRKAHFVDIAVPEQWTRLVRTLEGPCTVRRVPLMVEPPHDFVPRPAEYGRLKRALLDSRGEPVAITAALKGAGGYDKTTLARALCHDDEVQDAFHDGILWVTLGEAPGDLMGLVQDLIRALTGERPGFAALEMAAGPLAALLAARRCLIVVDDVWRRGDAEPFLRGGPGC